jgi:hypothetical protein
MRFSSQFLVVAGLVMFGNSAQPQTVATAGLPLQAYSLTIRSKQVLFKIGDEIRIEVVWKNTSNRPVQGAPVIPTAEANYIAYVEDDRCNPATETRLGRLNRTGKDESGRETVTVGQSAPIGWLQPGEPMTEQIVLNKLCDLSKPGRYSVRVQMRTGSVGAPKSNAITIQITDKAE